VRSTAVLWRRGAGTVETLDRLIDDAVRQAIDHDVVYPVVSEVVVIDELRLLRRDGTQR